VPCALPVLKSGPGLSAAWHLGAARGALEVRGGLRDAGWLILVAPGGGQAGNVAAPQVTRRLH
jgi:hypothetical protein